MKRIPKNRRLVLGIAVLTLAAGIAALLVTVLIGNRKAYPQRIIARTAAEFLAKGYDPVHVLPSGPVEVTSGNTWVVVTDLSGQLRASAAVDRGLPVSLASCREADVSANCFFVPTGQVPSDLTVELPSGGQQTLAISRYDDKASGYVIAGRMAYFSDWRWYLTMRIIIATWLTGIALFLIANRLLSKR